MPTVHPAIARALQLAGAGQTQNAIEALRALLRLKPGDAAAHMVLADLLCGIGRVEEGLAHLDRALQVEPTMVPALIGRASTLCRLNRFADARAAIDKALRLEPRNPHAHVIRAEACVALDDQVDAAASALEALRLDPSMSRAIPRAARALSRSGAPDRAIELLKPALAANPHDADLWSIYGFCILCWAGADPEESLVAQRERTRGWESTLPPAAPEPIHDPDPDRPLRIAYLAQDISQRSPIAFFLEPALEYHDREAFDVIGYLTQPKLGVMTPRMLGHIKHWVDVSGLSDADLDRRIRSDRIDILIELAGQTPGNRLRALGRRPAPISITAIGAPHTTGLSYIDRRLVDAVTDPPGAEAHWSERLCRLPGCFLCYRPPEDAPPPRAPRPLDAAAPVTFGSNSVAHKMGPEVVALWARLLREVPGSRLALKSTTFHSATLREAFSERFAAHGIAPDRVDITGRTGDFREHLGFYNGVDIALDPFPYTGTTTACEALWMGVPLITLLGRAHAGRVGASLLTAAGLTELIAPDPDAYIALGKGLASDGRRMAAYHTGLRDKVSASPLCDGPAYTRGLEATYRRVWRERCASAE